MASRQDSEDSDDYGREDAGDPYDYNNGIAPYPGAVWTEFGNWASNPIDPEIYDEQGNYRIPPEDIVVEPTPAAALAAASMPASRQPQESRIEQFRRRRRERARAYAPAPMPAAVLIPTPPPAAPTEAERIAEARIGLPAGWEPLISRGTNMIYYYNQTNGNKQYEVPTDDPLIVEASIGLPAGWVPLKSRSTDKIYFYNQNTGVKQVKRPTMGGKRTKRRQRSRAKRPKRKRSTRRRKRTTTRRK